MSDVPEDLVIRSTPDRFLEEISVGFVYTEAIRALTRNGQILQITPQKWTPRDPLIAFCFLVDEMQRSQLEHESLRIDSERQSLYVLLELWPSALKPSALN